MLEREIRGVLDALAPVGSAVLLSFLLIGLGVAIAYGFHLRDMRRAPP